MLISILEEVGTIITKLFSWLVTLFCYGDITSRLLRANIKLQMYLKNAGL